MYINFFNNKFMHNTIELIIFYIDIHFNMPKVTTNYIQAVPRISFKKKEKQNIFQDFILLLFLIFFFSLKLKSNNQKGQFSRRALSTGLSSLAETAFVPKTTYNAACFFSGVGNF